MRRPLAALLACALAVCAHAQDKPVEINAVVDYGRVAYALPVTVGDKIGLFLVAFEYRESAVSDEWLGDSRPDLSLAGIGVGTANVWPAKSFGLRIDGQPIIGILGSQAFEKMAIGFDVARKKVILWSKPDPANLAACVGESTYRIPLTRRSSGSATLQAVLNGKAATLVLTSHDNQMRLRPDLQTPADVQVSTFANKGMGGTDLGKATISLKAGVQVGPSLIPWAFYDDTFVDQAPELAGTYPLHTGLQPRVVIDFAGMALVVQRLTVDDHIVTELERLTRIPFRLKGDTLTISQISDDPSWATVKRYEGAEIRSMAGMDVAKIFLALRETDPLPTLKKLVDASRSELVVRFVVDPLTGELGNIKIPPLP